MSTRSSSVKRCLPNASSSVDHVPKSTRLSLRFSLRGQRLYVELLRGGGKAWGRGYFMQPISTAPEKLETLVMACCCLHNFLRGRVGARSIYTPNGSLDTEDPNTHVIMPGEWRQGPQSQGLQPLERQGSNRHSNCSKELREYFCEYFNSEDGSVSWQDNMI